MICFFGMQKLDSEKGQQCATWTALNGQRPPMDIQLFDTLRYWCRLVIKHLPSALAQYTLLGHDWKIISFPNDTIRQQWKFILHSVRLCCTKPILVRGVMKSVFFYNKLILSIADIVYFEKIMTTLNSFLKGIATFAYIHYGFQLISYP